MAPDNSEDDAVARQSYPYEMYVYVSLGDMENADLENNRPTKLPFNRILTTRECTYSVTLICSCDLDTDPLTVTYELDLDAFRLNMCTRNELSKATLSEVTNRTDTRTDATERGWQMKTKKSVIPL